MNLGLVNRFGNKIGIDLGTTNTVVSQGENVLASGPSVVVINTENERIKPVYGDEAYARVGALSPNEKAIWPMCNARVGDTEHARGLLKHYLRKANRDNPSYNSRIVVAVACELDSLYRYAVKDTCQRFCRKGGEVHLIEQPSAAMIAHRFDPKQIRSVLTIDIGGGTTGFSWRSETGDLVKSKSIAVAGNSFDKAIIEFLRKTSHIKISRKKARVLKENIGWAMDITNMPMPDNRSQALEIMGPDETGETVRVWISSTDIAKALSGPLEEILDFGRMFLADLVEVQPDLASRFTGAQVFGDRNMQDRLNGIVAAEKEITILNGGNALIPGMLELFSERLPVPPIQRSRDPLNSVSLGAARVAECPALLDGCEIRLTNMSVKLQDIPATVTLQSERETA